MKYRFSQILSKPTIDREVAMNSISRANSHLVSHEENISLLRPISYEELSRVIK